MPAARRAALVGLLTPVETVLHAQKRPTAATDPGSILLYERLALVAPDGRRTIVRQTVFKALSDAGARDLSDEVITYRKRDQTAYLLLAETIQPDGTRLPVTPDAILVQSPQRQADYSLYDDQAELKIIYPDIKAGSITHSIIVIQDNVAKLPGEYAESFNWGWTWPIGTARFGIRLPPSLASRLKIDSIGGAVPACIVSRDHTGRSWYDWKVQGRPYQRYEPGSPSPDQIGPSVHVSTLGDWDRIAAWYSGLMAGRGTLSRSLAREEDSWLSKAKSETEKIAILHGKVADRVRYVGLEFGAADYQPHDCNRVWNNQYGDCKDKANLLVALLRHAGIPADIALVNAITPGLVDRNSPTYRAFNHAIVAIPRGSGHWLFCDPTIAYSTPGMLDSRTLDRDVLVIDGEKARWVRTPAKRAGRISYRFDLNLGATGELSGWLTLTASDAYGAEERYAFVRLNSDDTRAELSKIVRGFYPGAEIVDVQRKDGPPGSPYVLRAYFIRPDPDAAGGGHLSLEFPSSRTLFADLGDRPDRINDFVTADDQVEVTASIRLPSKLSPVHLPSSFRFDSPLTSISASWSFSGSTCTSHLVLDHRATLIPASSFPEFYRASQSLRAWIGQQVDLTASSEVYSASNDAPSLDLPLMPSGRGEIDLVDKRYPLNGNRQMRRLALERTIQYFPDDALTVFRAGTGIAILDWQNNRYAAAHSRMAALLAAYSGRVDPESYAWAQVIDALVLRALSRPAEACAELKAVVATTSISDARRIAAALAAASILEPSDRKGALAVLEEAAGLQHGETVEIEGAIVRLLLESNEVGHLRARLAEVARTRPVSAQSVFAKVLGNSTAWTGPNVDIYLRDLRDAVTAACPTPTPELKRALAACSARVCYREIQRLLRTEITLPAFDGAILQSNLIPNGTAAVYLASIAQAKGANNPSQALSIGLNGLLHAPLNDSFPELLWTTASMADWLERRDLAHVAPAVCNRLLDLCDRLPLDSQARYEGRLLRAERLGRVGRIPDQQLVLRKIIETPQAPAKYVTMAAWNLGQSMEGIRDYAGALAAYASAEPGLGQFKPAIDAALHAVLINLDLGHPQEALRILNLCANLPLTDIALSEAPSQLEGLIGLARSGNAAAVWAASDSWWLAWRSVAESQGIPADAADQVAPVIPDVKRLGASLVMESELKDSKTLFRALSTLMSATRWQPSLYIETTSLDSKNLAYPTDVRAKVLDVMIKILEAPLPAGAIDPRKRQLLLASLLTSKGDFPEARRLVEQFDSTKQAPDATTTAMLLLEGHLALASGRDMEATAKKIESRLSDPQAYRLRYEFVDELASLYQKTGQTDRLRSLISRELKNPAISSSPSHVLALKKMSGTEPGADEFQAAVAAWMKSDAPGWLRYSPPFNSNDPRITNIDTYLKKSDLSTDIGEQVKIGLLAAQDPNLPPAKRQLAFQRALGLLISTAPNYSLEIRYAKSVYANTHFDQNDRLYALWGCLSFLAEEGRKAQFDSIRRNPLCRDFSANIQLILTRLIDFSGINLDSPAAILAAEARLARDPHPEHDRFFMTILFRRLLQLGDLDAAKKFEEDVPSWKFAPDDNIDPTTLQLHYIEEMHRAALINPIHEAMSRVILARYPNPVSLPAEFDDQRIGYPPQQRLPSVTFQACVHMVQTHTFERYDLMFWSQLLRNLPRDGTTNAAIAALFKAGMKAATTDALRNKLAWIFFGSTDTDDPVVAATYKAVCSAIDDPVSYPQFHTAFRCFELQQAYRHGETRDPALLFPDLTTGDGIYSRNQAALCLYTGIGDGKNAARVLDQMDASEFDNLYDISTVLVALKLTGRTEELKLAERQARLLQQKALVKIWALRAPFESWPVLSIAKALKDPSLLPDAWLSALRKDGDPYLADEAATLKAFLESRWDVAARESAACVAMRPTGYHQYLYLGTALAHLGRTREAIDALKIYTRYSKEELEYHPAMDLLARLEGRKSASHRD